MNVWKSLTAGLCALVFLCGSAPAGGEEKTPSFAPDATAESVVGDFLSENRPEELPGQEILIGYYNTVTGEEYYYRGDEYLYPASMYKVALCMHYARQAADGVLSWEDKINGVELGELTEGALEHSDNGYAWCMITAITNHMADYRRIVAPFYGLDPEELPIEYLRDGQNTPRQMIFNLRLLYQYPGRFPRVLEHMLAAEPEEYFLHDPKPWPVAHKYGVMDDQAMIINDCAVVYTRSPFLLAVFTRNVTDGAGVLSDLCARLGEYTEFDTDRRAAAPACEPKATPAPGDPIVIRRY